MTNKKNVDLGLSVLCAIARPGETVRVSDIADICGCKSQYISNLTMSALKKLKRNIELQALWLEMND